MEYKPRLQDEELAFRLECSGAALIERPKWCGKTTLAEHQAKSILRMQNPDKRLGYFQAAATKLSLLLSGNTPRLIDEWQKAPVLWDTVRVSVDSRNEPGLYILTGFNSVDNSKINHSGTRRIVRMSLCMRVLRAYSAKSDGKISYYHGRYGLEADCVLHLRDGKYALIEFKLGSSEIEGASTHLLEIKQFLLFVIDLTYPASGVRPLI